MEAFLRNRVTPLIFALLPVLPGGPVIAQSAPAMARLDQLVTACEAAWSGMAAPPAAGSAAGSLAGAQGMAAAKSLKALGIQMNLAPVADRDITPAHVMRGRSFGSDKAFNLDFTFVGQEFREFAGNAESSYC